MSDAFSTAYESAGPFLLGVVDLGNGECCAEWCSAGDVPHNTLVRLEWGDAEPDVGIAEGYVADGDAPHAILDAVAREMYRRHGEVS